MKILIIPNSKQLRSGKRNAKEYPFDKLYPLLDGHNIKILDYIADINELKSLLDWCDVWISVDTYFPHFVQHYGKKRGIVLWGKSDPNIFGYYENDNLLKDRRYLRKDQFDLWENEEWEDVFVEPQQIISLLDNYSNTLTTHQEPNRE